MSIARFSVLLSVFLSLSFFSFFLSFFLRFFTSNCGILVVRRDFLLTHELEALFCISVCVVCFNLFCVHIAAVVR